MISVLQRCDAVVFFEHILKITLTGEAKIAADLTKRFVCISQERGSFFHAPQGYVVVYRHTGFLLEMAEQGGTTMGRMRYNIRNTNGLVDMCCDILQALLGISRDRPGGFLPWSYCIGDF